MKSNVIPRRFYKITVRVLCKTNTTAPGDIINIYRNDSGLIGLNTRTGNYSYYPANFLRIAELCEFINVDK